MEMVTPVLMKTWCSEMQLCVVRSCLDYAAAWVPKGEGHTYQYAHLRPRLGWQAAQSRASGGLGWGQLGLSLFGDFRVPSTSLLISSQR